jgi:hypothetical protein
LIRSPFRGRSRQPEVRVAPVEEFDEVTVTRTSDCSRRRGAKLESELGEATYNCQCGFIWQAPVLTSVDCPHCGDSQAW